MSCTFKYSSIVKSWYWKQKREYWLILWKFTNLWTLKIQYDLMIISIKQISEPSSNPKWSSLYSSLHTYSWEKNKHKFLSFCSKPLSEMLIKGLNTYVTIIIRGESSIRLRIFSLLMAPCNPVLFFKR